MRRITFDELEKTLRIFEKQQQEDKDKPEKRNQEKNR